MNMNISCINADLMKEYFDVKHKPNLDEKLKSKMAVTFHYLLEFMI